MYKTRGERIKEVVLIVLGIVALGAMFLLSGSKGLVYHDDSVPFSMLVWIFLILLGSNWIYNLTHRLRDIEDRVRKLESDSK